MGGASAWRPDRGPRLGPAVDAEEFRTRHGELIAGVQLDELYQGTALVTRDGFRSWFDEAGLAEPVLIDLPSGALALRRASARRLTGAGRAGRDEPAGPIRAASAPWSADRDRPGHVVWMLQWNGYVPATVKTSPSDAPPAMVGVVHEPSTSVAV